MDGNNHLDNSSVAILHFHFWMGTFYWWVFIFVFTQFTHYVHLEKSKVWKNLISYSPIQFQPLESWLFTFHFFISNFHLILLRHTSDLTLHYTRKSSLSAFSSNFFFTLFCVYYIARLPRSFARWMCCAISQESSFQHCFNNWILLDYAYCIIHIVKKKKIIQII